MANWLKTNFSITVNEIEIRNRKLNRIILSNVYPIILNRFIINTLRDLRIKTIFQTVHMKAGFVTVFTYIKKYIDHDSVSKVPSSITITEENTAFKIFITDDPVTYF